MQVLHVPRRLASTCPVTTGRLMCSLWLALHAPFRVLHAVAAVTVGLAACSLRLPSQLHVADCASMCECHNRCALPTCTGTVYGSQHQQCPIGRSVVTGQLFGHCHVRRYHLLLLHSDRARGREEREQLVLREASLKPAALVHRNSTFTNTAPGL